MSRYQLRQQYQIFPHMVDDIDQAISSSFDVGDSIITRAKQVFDNHGVIWSIGAHRAVMQRSETIYAVRNGVKI